MPLFPCGRLDKRYLLAVNSKCYLAVSLPPALLCYDTSNIWNTLYFLKHPVFDRKKIPINMEGSCGLKACEKGLWLQGCQFDSRPSGNRGDGGGEWETLSPPLNNCCWSGHKASKWSSGNSVVIVGSSQQMRLSLCVESLRQIIGNMLFISLPGMV